MKISEKYANAKGITLITLIITIIIMLILVAVVVDIAVDGKLVDSAKEAVTKTNDKVEQHQNRIDGLMDELDKVLQSEGTGGTGSIEETHDWKYTDATLATIKCTCKKCKADENGDGTGITLAIGQEVDYKEGGTGSSTISGMKSGVSQGIIDGFFTASEFGTNGDQTISKDADTTWVVFGIEDSNGDKTFETLLLTTKTPTAGTITLYGADSYLYGADEVDRMCREIYGENARGMTIEDVNRTLGYTPTGGMYVSSSGLSSTGNFTTQLNGKIKGTEEENETYLASGIWTSISSASSLYSPEQNNNTGNTYTLTTEERTLVANSEALEEYVIDGYIYAASEEIAELLAGQGMGEIEYAPSTTSTTVKSLVFGRSYEYRNWLASRGVMAMPGEAAFGPAVLVGYLAGMCIEGTFWTYSGFTGYPLGLRAVVCLTSEVPAVEGT